MRSFFIKLPFAGALLDASPEQRNESFKEFFFIGLASFAPMWLAVLIGFIKPNTPKSMEALLGLLSSNFAAGEIFIYVVSFCAPVGWTMYVYNKNSRNLRDFYWYLVVLSVIGLVSVVIFTMFRLGELEVDLTVNLIGCSLCLVSLFVWFTSILHVQFMIDFEKMQQQQVNDLAKGMRPKKK